MSSTRRIFLAHTLGLCAALALARESFAEPAHLSEDELAAQALAGRRVGRAPAPANATRSAWSFRGFERPAVVHRLRMSESAQI